MRGLRKYPLLGTILTFAIVAVLVAGPALAMTASIQAGDARKGDDANIQISATVPADERVPIEAARLILTGPEGYELDCLFFSNGDLIYGWDEGDDDICNELFTYDMIFLPTSEYWTVGARYGYDGGIGYDFFYGWGYGYGYDEHSGTYPVAVIFDIYWATTDDTESGTYTAAGSVVGDSSYAEIVREGGWHFWDAGDDTFSVTSSRKTLGGSGGSTYTPPTTQVFDESGSLVAEGQFSLDGLSIGDTFTFESDGESHSGEIVSIGPDSVVIRFSSDPQDVELQIGETKEVDLDYDGINDIAATLNGITNGEADVTVVDIEYATPVAAEEPAQISEPAAEPETTGLGEVVSEDNMLITAIVVIIVIIVALGFIAKAPKKKK